MSFPDLQLVTDVLKAPGDTLPNVAEATGVPVNGNNTIGLPFVNAGIPPDLIDPSRLKIYFDPDPSRPAGGVTSPGVSDIRYVSLAADKQSIVLDFAQSGVGDAKVTIEIDHTIHGVGSNTPLMIGSTAVSGSTPPASFSASLTGLFATPLEIGADLISPTFNAAYTPAGTELFAELSDDDGNPAQDVLGVLNPITRPYTFQKLANGATVLFTLTANDGGLNVTDDVTATWLPRVFWGPDASPSLSSEADIEGLASSGLAANKGRIFTVTCSNEYIYYGFPTAFAAAPLDFKIGIFPGGFLQVVASVAVTANTPGAPAQTYQLWRSTNPLTGVITVEVTA